MHILLGALTTIVTILILLNRLAEAGIDLGGLNPYLWNRRRKWRKAYAGNPVFKIEDPMDVTAILMVAAVKSDGDMTKEDKGFLLKLFEDEFHLSKKDAAGLMISSTHLLGDGTEVRENIGKFLLSSKESFTEHLAESAISLISQATGDPEKTHPNTQQLLQCVKKELLSSTSTNQTWCS